MSEATTEAQAEPRNEKKFDYRRVQFAPEVVRLPINALTSNDELRKTAKNLLQEYLKDGD